MPQTLVHRDGRWPGDRARAMMVPCPPQQPIEFGLDAARATVVEIGSRAGHRAGAGSRPVLAGLAADRRLVPVAAALGAVAAVRVADLRVAGHRPSTRPRFGGTEVGDRLLADRRSPTWARSAPAYLAGLFLLVAAVVLALFGPPAGPAVRPADRAQRRRRAARHAGGDRADAGRDSRRSSGSTCAARRRPDCSSYGPGLWCAFAGVVLVAAGALSGRPAPAGRPGDGGGAGRRAEATRSGPGGGPAGRDERPPDEPFDLTVAPGAAVHLAAPTTATSRTGRETPGISG